MEWNKIAISEFTATTGPKTALSIWTGHEAFVFSKVIGAETLQIHKAEVWQ